MIPQFTIQACFDALLAGKCTHAVVPMENSSNGTVVFTLDILRKIFQTTSKPIHLVAEVYVPINHCLLSTAQDLSKVKRVYTHPQAWGQVAHFLSTKLPNVKRLDADSTSKGVELCKSDPEAAAIASSAAGVVHNVPVLVPNISDNTDNTTRFMVFSLDQCVPTEVPGITKKGSLASFTLPHDEPGALVKTLEVFAKHNISLCSITSRPSGNGPWNYLFWIEFLGEPNSDIINEARQYSEEFRVLGSFYRIFNES